MNASIIVAGVGMASNARSGMMTTPPMMAV